MSEQRSGTSGSSDALLSVDSLTRHFPVSGGRSLKAVDGVSFDIQRGTTMALVGESGSGKSTLGRCVVRMDEPTSGRILLDGDDISHLRHRELRDVRQRLQMVFQSPYTSLSPRMSIGESLAEPLQIHQVVNRGQQQDRIREALISVGLSGAMADRLPGQLSGGQRQRVGIARALILQPHMIVADEPTASLDLTSQAQIVNLMLELQQRLTLTMLFITHDLGLAAHLSHQCAVLYLGRIVEIGPTAELLQNPQHPYTNLLVATRTAQSQTPGPAQEVPSPIEPPRGCHFRSRCPLAIDRCAEEYPELRPTGTGSQVACHRAGELPSPSSAASRLPQPLPWPQKPSAPLSSRPPATPPTSSGDSHA